MWFFCFQLCSIDHCVAFDQLSTSQLGHIKTASLVLAWFTSLACSGQILLASWFIRLLFTSLSAMVRMSNLSLFLLMELLQPYFEFTCVFLLLIWVSILMALDSWSEHMPWPLCLMMIWTCHRIPFMGSQPSLATSNSHTSDSVGLVSLFAFCYQLGLSLVLCLRL